MRRITLLRLGTAALLFVARSAAATVTLIEWIPGGSDPQHTVFASTAASRQSGQRDLIFEPATIPFVDAHRASIGNAVSDASYDLFNSAFNIHFDEHSHSFGGGGARSRGSIYFTVDESVPYLLRGHYSFDSVAQSHEVELEVSLIELQTGEMLFDNFQWSNTTGEVFELGQQDGNRNNGNRLSGSLSGQLQANAAYLLRYDASSGNMAPTASGGAATGALSLAFVPEPTTSLLVGVGLAILGVHARRRRHDRASRLNVLCYRL